MNKLLLTILIATSFISPAGAKRISFRYLARPFTLFVPEKTFDGPRPVVVLLHGCKQSPEIILDGTRLEREAERNGFLILAPEQPRYYNSDHCWNWFLDVNQQRLPTNEMGQIIGAIELVDELYGLDRNKIFVTGISAGGVMAHNLTACYPDVFAASAIHSGLTYKTAENISEAQTVLTAYEQKSPDYLGKRMYQCARGKTQRLSRVLIMHGLQDSRVPPLHADLISKSQGVWRDFLDDGNQNGSATPATKKEHLTFPNGYQAEVSELSYAGFTEKTVMIKGLGHAWGGGEPISVNFDPKAPSSNDMILSFFGLIK